LERSAKHMKTEEWSLGYTKELFYEIHEGIIL